MNHPRAGKNRLSCGDGTLGPPNTNLPKLFASITQLPREMKEILENAVDEIFALIDGGSAAEYKNDRFYIESIAMETFFFPQKNRFNTKSVIFILCGKFIPNSIHLILKLMQLN